MNLKEFQEKYPPNMLGDLDLRGTGITSLPEGLTVGGEVYW